MTTFKHYWANTPFTYRGTENFRINCERAWMAGHEAGALLQDQLVCMLDDRMQELEAKLASPRAIEEEDRHL